MKKSAHLKEIANLLKKDQLDGFYLSHKNFFMTEFPGEEFMRLKWLTNFSGSMGFAFITKNKNYLFVDSRYHIQAKNEAYKDFKVLPIEEGFSPFIDENKNKNIGYDSKLVTESEISKLKNQFKNQGINLISINENPIDAIREFNHETKPKHAFLFKKYKSPDSYSKAILNKLNLLKLDHKNTLICCSESVNWLLDIRGKDTEFTPIIFSHLLIKKSNDANSYALHCFFNNIKSIENIIFPDFVKKYPIEKLSGFLGSINGTLATDFCECPSYLIESFLGKNKNSKNLMNQSNPCLMPKAIKNSFELNGIKKSHIEDGVSIVKFMHWLDSALYNNSDLDEYHCQTKLDQIRMQNKNCISLSFPTISASGANSAICHYRADSSNSAKLNHPIYLFDSGGQYKCGTTDITRMICIKKPTKEMMKNYTLVLKGHIALARAVFPQGTTGSQIEMLSRKYLWEYGLDFGHSTGHGIGCCLSVHEGPQALSASNNIKLQEGMVLSNEPGVYIENQYGIRIENVVVVEKSKNLKNFLCFNTITKAPISTKLIDKNMLTIDEIKWINQYHKETYESLCTFLNKEEKSWLKNNTKSIKN